MFYAYSALVLALLPLASAQGSSSVAAAANGTSTASAANSTATAPATNGTAPAANGTAPDTASIQSALAKTDIFGSVLPNNTVIRAPFSVVFAANSSTFPVSIGSNLTESQTADKPEFGLVTSNNITNKPYIIAIVDPDASVGANGTLEFVHYLAADVFANSSTNGTWELNSNSTPALFEYLSPAPPANSSAHRYVVVTYLQNRTGITPGADFNASSRANFNLTSFIDGVNTTANPLIFVGANVFYVSANDTTGSVKPNSTSGGAAATSPAAGAGGNSGAMKVGAAVAWTAVGVLTASGALFL